MSGITINDQYTQFAQQVAGDAISTLSNALDAMRNPALQVAERWSILANAYQSVFDSAFNKAVFYRGMAELAGNGPGTEGWQRIADSARELALQKGVLADQAFAEMVANKNLAGLSRWADPLAIAADGGQLAGAVLAGDIDKVGEISAGILLGSLAARVGGLLGLAFALNPIGIAILAGIFALAVPRSARDYGRSSDKGSSARSLIFSSWLRLGFSAAIRSRSISTATA